jgi:hypothetical protein
VTDAFSPPRACGLGAPGSGVLAGSIAPLFAFATVFDCAVVFELLSARDIKTTATTTATSTPPMMMKGMERFAPSGFELIFGQAPFIKFWMSERDALSPGARATGLMLQR